MIARSSKFVPLFGCSSCVCVFFLLFGCTLVRGCAKLINFGNLAYALTIKCSISHRSFRRFPTIRRRRRRRFTSNLPRRTFATNAGGSAHTHHTVVWIYIHPSPNVCTLCRQRLLENLRFCQPLYTRIYLWLTRGAHATLKEVTRRSGTDRNELENGGGRFKPTHSVLTHTYMRTLTRINGPQHLPNTLQTLAPRPF